MVLIRSGPVRAQGVFTYVALCLSACILPCTSPGPLSLGNLQFNLYLILLIGKLLWRRGRTRRPAGPLRKTSFFYIVFWTVFFTSFSHFFVILAPNWGPFSPLLAYFLHHFSEHRFCIEFSSISGCFFIDFPLFFDIFLAHFLEQLIFENHRFIAIKG